MLETSASASLSRDVFPTDLPSIRLRLAGIDPVAYARTRNFIDGAVTRLSPYISRGYLSCRKVYQHLLEWGHSPQRSLKFIQELAWREYWQRLWLEQGDAIFSDLRHSQQARRSSGIPAALLHARTGIEALDQALRDFYRTGYLHNHVRMYLAAVACQIGSVHWADPARWMYYHLLDGDLASNALSWQWVAGCMSGKKYYANQENINRYCHSRQRGTYLDRDYPELVNCAIPPELLDCEAPDFSTPLPMSDALELDPTRPLYVFNYYNLDPEWAPEGAQRVMLLEPEVFARHPVSGRCLDFAVSLARGIPGMQVFVGSFAELAAGAGEIHYREHPLNLGYTGVEHPREWMFEKHGKLNSFFSYWKPIERQLLK